MSMLPRQVHWSISWSDRLPAALLLCLALCASTAQAACVRNEPGRLWNYIGTLAGKYPVRMVLVFSGTQVQGVYAYASTLRDLRVAGPLERDSRLTLQEQDAGGKATGRFDVTFPERDPGTTYGDSPLTCDVIAGQWRKLNATGQPVGEPLAVYLRTEGATSGGIGRRYGVIGVRDDEVVNGGAARFWRALKAGDKAAVAATLRYPITVAVNGKRTRIADAAAMIAVYDTVFTQSYREAILADIPRHLFVRDQGAMLANGAAWIGASGKVIAINN
jgi:hypothetical protein